MTSPGFKQGLSLLQLCNTCK